MKNKLFTGIILCMAIAILQQACKSNTENKQANKSMVNTVSDPARNTRLSGTNVQHDTEIPDEPPPTKKEMLGEDEGVAVPQAITVEQKPGNTHDKNEVFTSVEEMPRFNGDINEYLKKNILYPPMAKENNIEGRVLVQFIVDKDGTIEKNSISFVGRNLGWGLPEEAIRVVSNMPPWIPGKQNGKNVKVKFILPVVFMLP